LLSLRFVLKVSITNWEKSSDKREAINIAGPPCSLETAACKAVSVRIDLGLENNENIMFAT
jgi:hypothetical protein